MPRCTVKTKQAEITASTYVRLRRFRAERLRKQNTIRRKVNSDFWECARLGKHKRASSISSLSSLSSLSSISSSAEPSSCSNSDDTATNSDQDSLAEFDTNWSDLLGVDWRTRRHSEQPIHHGMYSILLYSINSDLTSRNAYAIDNLSSGRTIELD